MTNQEARQMLDEIKEETKELDRTKLTARLIKLIEYLYNKLNT